MREGLSRCALGRGGNLGRGNLPPGSSKVGQSANGVHPVRRWRLRVQFPPRQLREGLIHDATGTPGLV